MVSVRVQHSGIFTLSVEKNLAIRIKITNACNTWNVWEFHNSTWKNVSSNSYLQRLQNDFRARMLTVPLFRRAQDQKKPKYPSISFWLNKLRNVQAIKYYVATTSIPSMHWHRTMWYIFKRKKLTGHDLCKIQTHTHTCVYICTSNISRRILKIDLSGRRTTWLESRRGETHERSERHTIWSAYMKSPAGWSYIKTYIRVHLRNIYWALIIHEALTWALGIYQWMNHRAFPQCRFLSDEVVNGHRWLLEKGHFKFH